MTAMIRNMELSNLTSDELYNKTMEGFKNLPRAQRRQQERELKENMRVMKSFSASQLKLIDQISATRSRMESEEQIIKYIAIVDTAITAYMYLKNENITREEVFNESKIINDMILEYRDMLNDLIKENRGNEEMVANQLEKTMETIADKCRELIIEGKNQSQALVILQHQFPTMSKAMLVNGYKHIKASIKEEAEKEVKSIKELREEDKRKEEEEINAAVEYIFEEPKKKSKDAKNESREEKVTIESKKVEVSIQPETNLRRVERREVFEGKFGKYEINNQELLFGDLKFESMDQVQEYEEKTRREFECRIAELKVVMAKV